MGICYDGNGRAELLLDDKVWYMKQMNPGQGINERLIEIPAERDICFSGWNAAKIPGDVYSDLQRAGVIEDPYIGRNMVKQAWVQYYEWWYVCRFNGPKCFKDMDLQLIVEGVDYSYDIWINNHYLGKHEGMFSPAKYDLTGLVNTYLDEDDSSECDNLLWIKIDPVPQSFYNIAGMHHTFSGDYIPGFVPAGIWRSVKIIATKNAIIEDVRIETSLGEEDNAFVMINSDVEIKYGQLKKRTIVAEIYNDDSSVVEVKEVKLHPGLNHIDFNIEVKEAKIWWPWDMGDQPLYYLKLTVKEDNIILDEKITRFGIREVEMKMNPGYTEDEAEYPWTFVINKKPIFLRSGCWGGPPSFLYGRNSRKKYKHFLDLAKKCNLNNLRIFGWHPPEVTDFYDICDELGITVWTNFPLASQVLRKDSVYINKVLAESTEIIKERRNHPSNIFWMGGEEVFFSEAQVRSHNRLMMELVGKCVKENTNIPYADASMMSSPPAIRLGYKNKECIHANGHYYAAGCRFMEDYFPNIDCCIIPELTAASAPCVESLKKFIPKEDLWPVGLSWGYLMANIDILKTLNVEVFGDEKFGSLEEFVDATQIAQGEIFKYALETIRRKKPHISGVSICHFITNRPLIKWEIVDYYGIPKKSYYYVQKAFQPLLPSLNYKKRRFLPGELFKAEVWVINDLYKEYNNIECKVEMFDESNNLLGLKLENINIEENSGKEFFEFENIVVGEIGGFFTLKITLTQYGIVIGENDYKLLINDQEKARQDILEYYKIHREKTLEYGKTLYRDFEDQMTLDWE